MDVNRVSNGGYQAPPPPPPPAPGSGEFAPAAAPVQTHEAPAPAIVDVRGVERAERAESRDMLQRAVDEINTSIAIHRRHMSIRMHEPTNRRMVTVYDSETNEAIREIPPERVLEAHASMLELAGLFVDSRG